MHRNPTIPDISRRSPGRTVLAYDPGNVRHNLEGHPEHAGRLKSTWALLQRTGLQAQCLPLSSRPATRQQVELVHRATMWERLQTRVPPGQVVWWDTDTYLNEFSGEVSLQAAGATLQVTEEVWTGRADNGMALVRPPGHHASDRHSMGFCLLNNVAIAARWAQTGLGVGRILILDFDVHHGNGTQDIFYTDPQVLYISLHQYPLFPMTGTLAETGAGAGLGTTCNLPLPAGAGDAAVCQLLERIVYPLVREFGPELVLVSAGFDGHWRDPLAHWNLSLHGYARLIRALLNLAEETAHGKLVVVLEGGYEPQVLSCGIYNTLQLLLGQQEFRDPFGMAKREEPDISELLWATARQWGYA